MAESASDLWARCLQSIQGKIQAQSFQTWFSQTSSRHLDPDRAVIEVPTSFFADWLEEHYAWLIQGTIEAETSWKPRLCFVIREKSGPEQMPLDFFQGPSAAPRAQDSRPAAPPVHNRAFQTESAFPLNPRYRFEHFVVGDSNEFSFTAAKAVAESPGKTAFNPLVIYGGVGLGKTHLLQAIGDYCVRYETASKVVYVTAEQFFTDYLQGIQKGDTSDYVKIYRNADVLLIDDIQFYVKTEACQRELIHTFNTLYQNDKQIVLSSDRPPSTLKGFEDRLISRFQWGLVTDIAIPDLETRIAILNQKAEEKNEKLPPDVARFLAEEIDSNVRELEGALIRLLSIAAHKRDSINLNLARAAVDGLGRTRRTNVPPPVSIEQIQKTTAGFFKIPVEHLVGATRKQEVAAARHVCMYLCKSLTSAPLKAIGSEFGNRDHTTVIYACKSVARKLSADPEFEDLINQLEGEIQNYAAA